MRFILIGLLLLTVQIIHAAPVITLVDKEQTGSQVTSFQVQVTPTAGSMVGVIVACSTTAITWTMSSPTLTLQQDCYKAGGGIDNTISAWSAGGASGATHTITINVSANEFVRWVTYYVTGIATNNRVIATNTGVNITQAITTGNVTTSTADTFLLAFVRTDGDETAHGTISAGAGYTLLYPYSANEPDQKVMVEYRVVAAGTYGNGFGLQSADSGGWVAGLVAYAPAGSGGFTPTAPFAPKRLRLIRSR